MNQEVTVWDHKDLNEILIEASGPCDSNFISISYEEATKLVADLLNILLDKVKE